MIEDFNGFNDWLDGTMMSEGVETRREFAQRYGMRLEDLHWAFCAGFNKGMLKVIEEGSK